MTHELDALKGHDPPSSVAAEYAEFLAAEGEWKARYEEVRTRLVSSLPQGNVSEAQITGGLGEVRVAADSARVRLADSLSTLAGASCTL